MWEWEQTWSKITSRANSSVQILSLNCLIKLTADLNKRDGNKQLGVVNKSIEWKLLKLEHPTNQIECEARITNVGFYILNVAVILSMNRP